MKIVAVLTARPGRGADLEQLMRGMVAASRQEPGNLRYDLWRDEENADRLIVDELYRDAAAIAAHRASPHFQDYQAKIADLADRSVLVAGAVDVA